MSERTTIGGTVYESIGSSSSNLLLKCNGTARIQWGSKLIDLIKNGKIASENSSSPMIFNVTNESEIKQDGVYILTNDENTQIVICKDKNKYDLTNAKLYIAADVEQSLTSDQKKCALFNIGAYYNTYSDLEQSGVKDGIVYVMDTKTLYTVQNGIIAEFEAKMKTGSVNESESETSNIINDSVQIVLSIDGQQYLVLTDEMITAKQSIQVHTNAQISSEGANSSQGYRLFIDGGTSVLEVDEIRVRNGIPKDDYTKITYSKLRDKIDRYELSPNMWYLIEDFQNHWKLPAEDNKYNRPILIRAITDHSFYNEGLLFQDQRITIHYDPNYQEMFQTEFGPFKAQGRITFMKDENGNEANFDFLDYCDCNDNELTLLYDRSNIDGKTIFPPQSYNNKLTVYDLKGVDIDVEGKLYTNNTGTNIQFGDNLEWTGEFHDNVIECRKNFIIKSECQKFYNNTLVKVGNVTINCDVYDSRISNMYTTQPTAVISDSTNSDETDFYKVSPYNPPDLNYKEGIIDNFAVLENLTNTSFNPIVLNSDIINTVFEGVINSQININVLNSSFGVINKTILGNQQTIFKNLQFKNIYNCQFNTEGNSLSDVLCIFDIHNCTFTYSDNSALYDSSIVKELTLVTGENKKTYYIQILRKKESAFFRGMIVMHSGMTAIPEGWAVCDGKIYNYLGEEIQTPDLRGKFIKANVFNEDGNKYICDVSKDLDVDDNNQITLQTEHLPEHHHPHQQHTHTISGTTVAIENSGDLTFSFTQSTNTVNLTVDKGEAIITEDGVTTESGEFVTDIQDQSQPNPTQEYIIGGNHTHNATVTNGSLTSTTSEEQAQFWENKAIKIEPNYYSLIFIMKL